MILPGVFYLPDYSYPGYFYLPATDGVSILSLQKPVGYKFCFIRTVSGGGGGGGGFTAAAAAQKGGGGGGAACTVSKYLYLADSIPDVLYYLVGTGGPGGTAGNPGTQGGNSLVLLEPVNDTQHVLALAYGSGSGPTGGTAGTGAAGGTGGSTTGGTVNPVNYVWMEHAFYISTQLGQSGANGGTSSQGFGITLFTSGIYHGGTGGGGSTSGDVVSNGGTYFGNYPITSGFNGGTGVAGGGGAGKDGFFQKSKTIPYYSIGGLGGGSSSTGGTGGKGGAAGPGSGGGGGGAGVTGGAGGAGGDGYIEIIFY